jgi:hypothetical protein
MRFSLTPPHFCQFPGCRRLSRATPMALHLHDTHDHPRIAWVCAKHSLLFYAGDPEVVSWVHDTADAGTVEGCAAALPEPV